MRHYPLCKICGLPVGWYDRKAHRKCIKGKNHHLYRKNNKPFIQYDKKGEIVTRWESLSELERVTCGGIKAKAVSKVLHGEFRTHKKFTWVYEASLQQVRPSSSVPCD